LFVPKGLIMKRKIPMKLKVIIHKAEEGGYWVDACISEGI
jgi:hypothetical protein